ncbi:hypothetical protein JKP88DRAFT_270062 [Tribonema minus]|uniref:Uncharacterized protein n=1 Tax=Tribonema minus TaxID=303371 RepID=A0A835YXY2_9STRA|nr:hypothetical protein JKP88DRAFT_270062 [Tribonema minus]
MSLIAPDNMWGMYAAISSAAAAGMALERTKVGSALSGAVCSMLIASLLCNAGVIPPTGSPHTAALQIFAVKLATPLLLLGADLRKVLRETGKLLGVFLLAAAGTALGATVATLLLRQQLAAVEGGWRVLAALAAKNIGGGLNFVAAAELLHVPSAVCVTALAVDNLLGLLYFPLVGWLGRNEPREPDPAVAAVAVDDGALPPGKAQDPPQDPLQASSSALALGFCLVAASEALAARFLPDGGTLISTALAVTLATAAPGALAPLVPPAERFGRQLLFLFFASVGASAGTVGAAARAAGAAPLLLFGAVMYAVHLAVAVGLGARAAGLREALVASNAAVGNAATASAMAAGKGWHSLALPALLVGTLGNAIGTAAGVALGALVLQPILASAGL